MVSNVLMKMSKLIKATLTKPSTPPEVPGQPPGLQGHGQWSFGGAASCRCRQGCWARKPHCQLRVLSVAETRAGACWPRWGAGQQKALAPMSEADGLFGLCLRALRPPRDCEGQGATCPLRSHAPLILAEPSCSATGASQGDV